MVPFAQLPLHRRLAISQAQLRRRATQAEKEFQYRLARLGVSYRFQVPFQTPYPRIVDFYLPDRNLIIEIDGACHDPEKDQRRDAWFMSVQGIRILRLTNEQVFGGDFPAL